MRAPQIELGMKVWARDGLLIGKVGRVWQPDGSIIPPLPGTRGAPDVVAGIWTVNDNEGLLQVSRFLAPDWFIPVADVASVVDHDVHLAFTEKQAPERGWHKRPALIDMVYAGDERTKHPVRRATKGTIDADPITDDRQPGDEAPTDPKLAAILLDHEMDLWRASIVRPTRSAGSLASGARLS